MSKQSPTGISWTDLTWNPGIFGCEKVSPACKACYAMKMARRLKAMGVAGYASVGGAPDVVTDDGEWTGVVRVNPAESVEASADKALPKRKPARVFVTSMADLFHQDVPFLFVDAVFDAMDRRPHLTFQVLTKRAQRMAEYAAGMRQRGLRWPRNVWAGVTVEDQRQANERIPWLLKVAARVRFLSVEPMLGPIRLGDVPGFNKAGSAGAEIVSRLWVIAGGESGADARPAHPDWFRSLRDQCAHAGVPFHFKQWGEWAPGDRRVSSLDSRAISRRDGKLGEPGFVMVPPGDGGSIYVVEKRDDMAMISRIGKHAAGRLLDGVLHDAMPNP